MAFDQRSQGPVPYRYSSVPSVLGACAERDATAAGSMSDPGPPDFYLVDELLEPAERELRDRLRAFCEREVIPVINHYWERAEFPFELIPKVAALDIAGGTIDGYGCPGYSDVAAGLINMEWARADGSMGTF